MKNNKFKIYIEVPEGWFDTESPTGWASKTIRDEAVKAIKEAVIEQFISQVELPDIFIPPAELREAVKNRMADEIIEKGKV